MTTPVTPREDAAATLTSGDAKKIEDAKKLTDAMLEKETAMEGLKTTEQIQKDFPEKKDDPTLREREKMYRDRINKQDEIIDEVKKNHPGGDIQRLFQRFLAILIAVAKMDPKERVGMRERIGRFMAAVVNPHGAGVERYNSFVAEYRWDAANRSDLTNAIMNTPYKVLSSVLSDDALFGLVGGLKVDYDDKAFLNPMKIKEAYDRDDAKYVEQQREKTDDRSETSKPTTPGIR